MGAGELPTSLDIKFLEIGHPKIQLLTAESPVYTMFINNRPTEWAIPDFKKVLE